MKRKTYIGVLIITAILSLTVSVAGAASASWFTSAAAFPFEQIGIVLRSLSLSGSVGNIFAIIIYIFICLLPIAFMGIIYFKKKLMAEDAFLVILSIALFISIYLMINPAYIVRTLGMTAQGSLGKAMLGGCIYAILAAYLVIKLMRAILKSSKADILKRLYPFTGFLGIIFVICAFGVCVGDFISSIGSVKAANTMSGLNLFPTYAFLFLDLVVNALPYILDTIIAICAMDMLKANSYETAQKLSKLCAVFLSVTVSINAVFYILQLIFAKQLHSVSVSVNIPIFSIVFVLLTMLLSIYIGENEQLKEENDSFI